MCGVFASISPFTVSNFGRCFFCVVVFLAFNSVLWCGCQSSVTESFANLKLVKIG